MLAALALALLIALGLGIAAYALTSSEVGLQNLQPRTRGGNPVIPPAEFIFFSIFALLYLLWATLPLSIGSSRQFDPGNLLLYPISLRKLFAVDFFSEIAIDYLSAGLDPKKSVLFIQSLVPEHAELHLLLSMITPLAWLERVPTFKEQQQELGPHVDGDDKKQKHRQLAFRIEHGERGQGKEHGGHVETHLPAHVVRPSVIISMATSGSLGQVPDRFIPKGNRAAEEKYDTTDHRADPIVNPEEVRAPDDTQNLSHEFRRVSML